MKSKPKKHTFNFSRRVEALPQNITCPTEHASMIAAQLAEDCATFVSYPEKVLANTTTFKVIDSGNCKFMNWDTPKEAMELCVHRAMSAVKHVGQDTHYAPEDVQDHADRSRT